jgi:glycosyltransferase involved in cell wall biosynthesis
VGIAEQRRQVRLVAYTDNVVLGGADISMAHVLARLDSSVEVTVLGVASTIAKRVASGREDAAVRIVPRPRSGHDWTSLRAHVRALREIRPDIVHANLSSPWSCQYCIAGAGLVRYPRVVAVYQLTVPPISRAQWRAKRLTARAVDRHVGVGQQTSREVETLVRLPAGSVLTIHNGVPDQPPAVAHRRWPGLVVGAIGRFERQKGFDLLIRALAEIDGVSLVLVGGGSEQTPLEELAERVGVADRVVWQGWTDDARSYVGSFDVFALPSRFEGFPLALLEALLARSAVVAADVGSVAEAVRDGETGLLVPAEDPRALARAIRRLLEDPELRQRLGEQGRQLVLERFTADHMTHAFERLYRELLSREGL